ncbi:ES1 protein homolog, mitochondrial-like [Watersipora subatra]|uniref:ES1 protein homolog, mitochondrial-like n=1 Tax=Watersipora subatra TaxID=2589382 RepID=UPI00355C2CE9
MLARNFGKRIAGSSFALFTARTISLSHRNMAKVAMVLHGCGVYDGTEVHEASACLVHLSHAGSKVELFAPDVEQMHTIDHTKGTPMEPNRNVLVESARIARGKINSLSTLKASEYDLLVVPGGFGAAKNLSDWAVKGPEGTVNAEFERTIKDFHTNKKPIALCCITPVLAAKTIAGCEVTVGQSSGDHWPYAETCGGVEKAGAKSVAKDVTEIHVDEVNRLVTSPAFMYHNESEGWNSLHLIYDGIGKMITEALKMCK